MQGEKWPTKHDRKWSTQTLATAQSCLISQYLGKYMKNIKGKHHENAAGKMANAKKREMVYQQIGEARTT